MRAAMIWRAVGFFAVIATVSCANHPCRQIGPEAEKAGIGTAASAAEVKPTADAKIEKPTGKKTILMAKADGSRQCNQGSGLSLEDAEKKDLVGIKTFSKNKRHDGKIRTQVCGNATGMMNVFEISADEMPKLEKQGYKKVE